MSELWDARFMGLAAQIAGWSKDPSTSVGCVLVRGKNDVVSIGYNGPPAGVDDHMVERGREVKLAITLHAEKNALLRAREDVRGCTIYVWPMPPCAQCAAAIIQAGIARVVSCEPTADQYDRWGRDWALAEEMYRQTGVVLETEVMA